MEYLSSEHIDAVASAALEMGFADAQVRPLLFRGIMPLYVGSLPSLAAPALQLQSDLGRMNTVERLIDGTVPLQVWLQNAVKATLQDGPRGVFQKALDSVAVHASAEPAPPPATELGELKEEIVFSDDTVPFEFLRLGWESGAAVARLSVPPFSDDQPVTVGAAPAPPHIGTGWLITPGLVMTNYHVVAARSAATIDRISDADLCLQGANTVAEFDLDVDDVAVPALRCSELVAWDRTLDYAVLRLQAATQRRPLPLSPEPPSNGGDGVMAVNIIQHPMGQSKRVGLRNNLVTASTERDLRYFTDTRKGSSGSPVLDDAWRVVALHRGSRRVEGVTFQGRSTAYVNVGTRMRAIVADIGQRYPDVGAEIAPGNGV